MRVFFDASVIIAAFLSPAGGSAKTLKLIKSGLIRGVTSQTVIEEALEEKHLLKIKSSKQDLEGFIASSGLIVRSQITPDEITPYQNLIDPDDAHLIAGANLTKCTHLVTLDKKHLLRADIKEKFSPLRIVSPKELLEDGVRSN
ncbi:MAG: putative toxin-antitoxin system toxin component, PIN family [Candidatus Woykebacteria bacterium]